MESHGTQYDNDFNDRYNHDLHKELEGWDTGYVFTFDANTNFEDDANRYQLTDKIGTYIVTYTVTDRAGNMNDGRMTGDFNLQTQNCPAPEIDDSAYADWEERTGCQCRFRDGLHGETGVQKSHEALAKVAGGNSPRHSNIGVYYRTLIVVDTLAPVLALKYDNKIIQKTYDLDTVNNGANDKYVDKSKNHRSVYTNFYKKHQDKEFGVSFSSELGTSDHNRVNTLNDKYDTAGESIEPDLNNHKSIHRPISNHETDVKNTNEGLKSTAGWNASLLAEQSSTTYNNWVVGAVVSAVAGVAILGYSLSRKLNVVTSVPV